MMGGSFNTREFFHGRSQGFVRGMRWARGACSVSCCRVAALALARGRLAAAGLAALGWCNWPGCWRERWIFFAEARHPQNLYMQGAA